METERTPATHLNGLEDSLEEVEYQSKLKEVWMAEWACLGREEVMTWRGSLLIHGMSRDEIEPLGVGGGCSLRNPCCEEDGDFVPLKPDVGFNPGCGDMVAGNVFLEVVDYFVIGTVRE